MRQVIIVLLIAAVCGGQKPYMPPHSQIEWLSIEEALERTQKEPRKILIDVYTNWCGWCKKMDKETFNNPKVVDFVNRKYYAVKYNAEATEPVTLKDTTFNFIKVGDRGYHQLALALLNGEMSYPTVVFLNEDFSMLQRIRGYQNAATFEKIVKFFGDNHHKQTPWEQFDTHFNQLYKQ